jgi:hypothetical protein
MSEPVSEAGENGRVALNLSDDEARAVHHALSTTVQLMDMVGDVPDSAPLHGKRDSLIAVARRLDHECNHHGAVPNPHESDGITISLSDLALVLYLDVEALAADESRSRGICPTCQRASGAHYCAPRQAARHRLEKRVKDALGR